MKRHRFRIYSDLFFFLVFFPLLIMLLPVDRWLEHRPLFLGALIAYLSALYFFYRRMNVPELMLRKQYWKGAACLLLVMCSTYLFARFSSVLTDAEDVLRLTRNKMQVQSVWFLTLTVTGYCFSNNLLAGLFKLEMSRQGIEAEKNRAELALYKSQINPHFLFNTLNTLYGLLITHSARTEQSFEKFIELIRYMYRNANRDFIPVREEVEYICQYVELQSLRLNEHTRTSFEHEVEEADAQIPPMLLITFVENAFKYGVSSDADSFIRISLRQQHGTLLFTVVNPVLPRESKESEKMGIANCRRRLELLYPQRHKLVVAEEEGLFRVELKLDLTCDTFI